MPRRANRLPPTPKTRSAASSLDGAWWPRSRDVAAELPSLADALEARWGRVTRTAVKPSRRPAVPCRVSSSGHALHMGWTLAVGTLVVALGMRLIHRLSAQHEHADPGPLLRPKGGGWGDRASRRTPPADLSLRSEGSTPSCALF
ncbi:DUF5994 family protein [Streptomyces sp. HNM0645]|nr:DUF5994 family protein [Streptomyces sp. HNM0645]